MKQFCVYPCTDPYEQAIEQHYPPTRTSAPPDPSASIFVPTSSSTAQATSSAVDAEPSSGTRLESELVLRGGEKPTETRRDTDDRLHPRLRVEKRDLTDQQLLNPPYAIANAAGQLSNRTAYVSRPLLSPPPSESTRLSWSKLCRVSSADVY